MKVLYFEIWGDFAHFRKPYTTSSPLTFPLPPRTAVAGVLGALIGKDKNDITCQNEESYIAVSLINPVKKTRFAINLSKVPNKNNMKQGYIDLADMKNRTPQIRYEFLKDVRYGIYFSHKDANVYNAIKQALVNHESFYTPYLGISELIANFEFISEYDADEKGVSKEELSFSCVVPKRNIKDSNIILEDNAEYFTVRMPNMLSESRIVQDYVEVVFERSGKKNIKAVPLKYWVIKEKGENIIFL